MAADRVESACREVWLFDLDGTLVDSFDGLHLRPLVTELFQTIRAMGGTVAIWSAGGEEHARRLLDWHDLFGFVTAVHDKRVDRAGRWQLSPTLLDSQTSVICVDDQPAQLPTAATHVPVFPYLRPNPHDRALEPVIASVLTRHRLARNHELT